MNRRNFLQKTAITTTCLSLANLSWIGEEEKIRFGIVADAHQDLMPDVEQRMELFIESSSNANSDFILQLGDFCHPIEKNRNFMKIWRSYEKPSYHVLGNHDMDLASKAKTLDFWEMPARYYSFEQGAFHFIVLDGNLINQDGKYSDYDTANFYIDSGLRTWMDPEQLEWLKDDLRKTDKPTIVFSHQSLVNDLWGIKNRSIVQQIFEEENERFGKQKVLACFNGHNHIDYLRKLNGIYYIDINSLSYQWLGQKYLCKTRYSQEVYDAYPLMDRMAPYQDPIFGLIEIDAENIRIKGRMGKYIGPSPQSLGLDDEIYGFPFTPHLSSRELKRK
ncbi:MAG: metallophosphoesterase [Bacteroidia bacterium]|nr:metallophosphoesterase [Bacteroidia bacterium]